MQSLPTTITTDQLNRMVDTMATLPSAEVTRHELTVAVTARKRATGERVTVFRAVTTDGQQWAAMAVPGLISTTLTATL